MASFARGVASLTRIGLSTSKTPLQIIHRRGLADHHGPRKDPFWEDREDPLQEYNLNSADLVTASANLLYCGLVFYVGYKLGACSQGKK